MKPTQLSKNSVVHVWEGTGHYMGEYTLLELATILGVTLGYVMDLVDTPRSCNKRYRITRGKVVPADLNVANPLYTRCNNSFTDKIVIKTDRFARDEPGLGLDTDSATIADLHTFFTNSYEYYDEDEFDY